VGPILPAHRVVVGTQALVVAPRDGSAASRAPSTNHPGARRTNAAGVSAPAPSGTRPSTGTPFSRGNSTTLQRSARPGSAGHDPTTIPAPHSPADSIARSVSSVSDSVPSPARATTITGASSATARSSTVTPVPRRTSSPPAPSIRPSGGAVAISPASLV